MKKLFGLVVIGTMLSSPAFAAKARYHCVDKNGKDIAATTAKACKAGSGRWVKVKAAPRLP